MTDRKRRGNGGERLLYMTIGIFFVFSMFVFGQGPSEYEGRPIVEINTTGNASLSVVNILSRVRSREGQLFSTDVAAEDSRRIAEIEGVDYAYYNVRGADDGVKLTFVVVEKNVVRKLSLIGNEKFSDDALIKQLDFARGDYLDMFLVAAGADAIEAYYKKKGFPEVEVEFDRIKTSYGEVEYTIDEGPRIKVKKIEFEGNNSIKSSELKSVIKTRTREWLLWPSYLNDEKIEGDITRIEQAYQKRGFLDAKVSVEKDYNAKRDAVGVTFVVDEGQIYIVSGISIEGNEFFGESELRENLRLVDETFYSTERAEFDRRKIWARYAEKGFTDVEVVHRRRFAGGNKVAAEFEVAEGDRYKIGKIEITGNTETHDKVIRRVLDEYDFKPGQWYNADIARGTGDGELEKNVQRTVLTESALITPGEKKKGWRDVLVNITEGQTGAVIFGAGVDSSSGIVGQLMWEQRNFDITDYPESLQELLVGDAFKGAGQKLRLSFEPGTEVTRYGIHFTEPYLYDRPIGFTAAIQNYMRDRESYDEERVGGYLTFTRRYRNKWYVGLAIRVEEVDVDAIDSDAPQEIFDVSGSNVLLGTRIFAGRDTTDSRFNPTAGTNYDFGYEQVYGDFDFGVVSGTHRWYYTLYEDLAERKTVLEAKLHGATIVGSDAPVYEKFYAGGIGSIRGFEYRGVSTRGEALNNPNVKDDPIGSDWILTGSTELVVPLTEAETVSGLLFVDSGLIDTGGIRSAVGTGIQILIPQWFGPVPMRFEIAAPLTKEDDDDTQVFSFSVGRLF